MWCRSATGARFTDRPVGFWPDSARADGAELHPPARADKTGGGDESVPVDRIDEAVQRIRDGSITAVAYDPKIGRAHV